MTMMEQCAVILRAAEGGAFAIHADDYKRSPEHSLVEALAIHGILVEARALLGEDLLDQVQALWAALGHASFLTSDDGLAYVRGAVARAPRTIARAEARLRAVVEPVALETEK